MTADFSQLSKLNTVQRTASYTLFQVEGEPVFTVSPASESNKPYFNAFLRGAKNSIRRLRSGTMNESMLAEQRDKDRELYAQHVVKGWTGVLDSKGQPAEFNQDNCRAFLDAMPNWLFDDLRNFCGDPANFIEVDQMSAEDAKELGKN